MISPNLLAIVCCDVSCRWSSSVRHHWHHRNPHRAAPACTPGGDCDYGAGAGAGVRVGASVHDDVPDVAARASVAWPAAVWTATGPDSAASGNDRWRCPHWSCCHRSPKLKREGEKGKRRLSVSTVCATNKLQFRIDYLNDVGN